MNFIKNISERVVAAIIAAVLIAIAVTAWTAFKSVDTGQVTLIGFIAFGAVIFGINQVLVLNDRRRSDQESKEPTSDSVSVVECDLEHITPESKLLFEWAQTERTRDRDELDSVLRANISVDIREIHNDVGSFMKIRISVFSSSIYKLRIGRNITGRLRWENGSSMGVPPERAIEDEGEGATTDLVLERGESGVIAVRQYFSDSFRDLVVSEKASSIAEFDISRLNISVEAIAPEGEAFVFTQRLKLPNQVKGYVPANPSSGVEELPW